MGAAVVDRARLQRILARERDAYVAARPRSADLTRRALELMPDGAPMQWMRIFYEQPAPWVGEGSGARFRDADHHEYIDFNLADMSTFCGQAPAPVVAAVAACVARGSQFLLPHEDAFAVAGELRDRWGLPQWQFTLAASSANTEAIRLARVATGRELVLFFDGKYHGHFDDALVALHGGHVAPEEPGVARAAAAGARIVQFNDAGAVREALAGREVALVLTEPALTNAVGLVLPEPEFHAELRHACDETGTLLAYDETHTHIVGRGGMVRMLGLGADIVTSGKAIAGGIPLGVMGMSAALAQTMSIGPGVDATPRVAMGGTLFANPLSLAAARATLELVLTDAAYAHASALGARLADGIEAAVGRAGLPWATHRLGPRFGVAYARQAPGNAAQAFAIDDPEIDRARWLYLANRGIWDAIAGAGPTCSLPMTADDVDRYVEAFGEFVDELVPVGPAARDRDICC